MKPETSVSSGGPVSAEDTPEIPGVSRTTPIAVCLEELRAALTALHVPPALQVVQEIDTEEDLYTGAQGTVSNDEDQYTALLALLHRVVTTMRAGHALGIQSEDTDHEKHVLQLDRGAAATADFHVLAATSATDLAELHSPEYARLQLAGNLSRSTEEARWLAESLGGMVTYAQKRLLSAGVTGQCDEHIPGPLFAARAAADAAYGLLLIAYIETAKPDAVDSEEAQLLGDVLDRMRAITQVLTSYGLRRGLLVKETDAKGRTGYRVVLDIVAAAAGDSPASEGGS